MDDKTKNPGKANEPETRSAFARRDKAASPGDTTEVPIPSQPRSFSPVRPQRNAAPRKPLTTPSTSTNPSTPAASDKPKAPEKPDAGVSNIKVAPSSNVASDKKPEPVAAAGLSSKPAQKPADSSKSTSSFKARSTVGPTAANAAAAKLDRAAGAGTAPAATAVAAGSSVATPPRGTTSQPPQSSSAGGDTIRLRVTPRTHARTLNTSPGRGIRRRLPDIRQGRTAAASGNHYGPFSLFFGFLWLIFKMIFFTALVLGLGAMIGFMVMTEYIKTPETIVPNVSGMKIDEAFEVLSDKNLGVIKLRTESSALVAPGEIVSQQPPAGATAKENTDVGVVISSGRSQYVVPDVVGETRENAINKIRGARLEVGNILPLEDNSVPAGSVISQTPMGGTGADDPMKVDLMISAGPPGKSLNMPDLTGLTVLEARAALKAVGIENVVTVPEDAEDTAKVQSQMPLVSKTVFQTDKVTLNTEEE